MTTPPTIGVVTSVWGDYGRWLPEWVRAVADQTRRPDLVTIVDAGADDIEPTRHALDRSGLDWQIIADSYRGIGAARNRAVEATPTDWVLHPDADDLLLPHCLADVTELADRADVIGIGMWRRDREVLFPHASTAAALGGRQVAFSCGAFRRAVWERSPWHTANQWVDSTFWVGLARAGATFTATRRAGAVYRQHPTSMSHTLTAADRAAAMAQLQRMIRNPGWSP